MTGATVNCVQRFIQDMGEERGLLSATWLCHLLEDFRELEQRCPGPWPIWSSLEQFVHELFSYYYIEKEIFFWTCILLDVYRRFIEFICLSFRITLGRGLTFFFSPRMKKLRPRNVCL